MKVTVKDKFLNVRLGAASLNAPNSTYLSPGDILEVDGQLYKGDSYDGIDTWMKDDAGNYYWSGGVSNSIDLTANTKVELSDIINYNVLIQNIPQEWRQTLGEDVVVAIIDTGISNIVSSNFNIIKGYNSILKVEDSFDDAISGHGTFVAGLIGANGGASDKIVGVAPNVKLIIVKASDSGFFGSNDVAFGIKWLLETCPVKPDIINISCDFPAATNAGFLIDSFEKFAAQGTHIFAAAGDNQALFQSPIFYPASTENVFAVGSLQAPNTFQGSIYSKVRYLMSEQNLYSLGNKEQDQYVLNFGSSFATAITTGVFSLALSYHRKINSTLSATDFFEQQITSLSDINFIKSLKIFKS